MRRLVILLLMPVLLAPSACGGSGPKQQDDRRRSVVAAFYPLEFVAETIASDRADVAGLTPDGVSPHKLELTAAQVRAVSGSDLFIYLGRGFQPAVEELIAEASSTLDVETVVRGSARTDDAHIWLDPALMLDVVDAVADALARVDADNAGFYRDNADRLLEDLFELDADFQQGLTLCRRREIVTSHEAFAYLAERLNLTHVAIAGQNPAEEPTARQQDEAAGFAGSNELTTIFVERLVDDAPARSVAERVGAATALLDPLESRPPSGSYLTAMRSNLQALRSALECR